MNKIWRLIRYDWPLHFVLVLTNWLPDNVPFLKLRGRLASCFLGSCAGRLEVGRNVTFYNPSAITLGSDVYVAQGCWFMAGAPIVVESEVLFGPYCVIVSSEHSRQGRSFRFGASQRAPIRIGQGAWLAAHVVVTAGTAVGEGSIVGAGAVVTRDLPADTVAAGQPARPLRSLE